MIKNNDQVYIGEFTIYINKTKDSWSTSCVYLEKRVRKIRYTYESLDQIYTNKYVAKNKYIRKADLDPDASDEESDIKVEEPASAELSKVSDEKIKNEEQKIKKPILAEETKASIISKFVNVKVKVREIGSNSGETSSIKDEHSFEGTLSGDIEDGKSLCLVGEDKETYLKFDDVIKIKTKEKDPTIIYICANSLIYEVKRVTDKGAYILFQSDWKKDILFYYF